MKKKICALTEGAKATVSQNRIYSIVIVASVVSAVVFSIYFINFSQGLSTKTAVWGQFGDYIGGLLNPILSFLALIAVVMSLKSQSEQVTFARSEAQAAIDMQKEQTAVFQQQNFESVFFRLLQFHNVNMDRVNVSVGDETLFGERAFAQMIKNFNFDVIYEVEHRPIPESIGGKNLNVPRVVSYTSKFMGEYGADIIHCFRIFEEILEYIGEQDFSGEDDYRRYVSIALSLLSQSQLECLLFYALSVHGERAKKLMLKYEVFERLPERTFKYCAMATLVYVEN